MNGFKNIELNNIIIEGLFLEVIDMIFIASKRMNDDFIKSNNKIKNDENIIRNILYENYLMNDDLAEENDFYKYFFSIESMENFDGEKYKGRTDIKIINKNFFKKKMEYFTIECKRLDGNSDLNKKYVQNGIARFATIDKTKPLYSSHFHINAMFGFLVENNNIDSIVDDINKFSNDEKHISIISQLNKNIKSENLLYESSYETSDNDLKLFHMFFDFSSVIRNDKESIKIG